MQAVILAHTLDQDLPGFGEHVRASNEACMCFPYLGPKEAQNLRPYHNLISSALYSHYNFCEIFKYEHVCL